MATDNLMPQSSASVIKHFMLRSSTTGQGLTGKVAADFTGTYNIAGGAEVTLSFSSGSPGDAYSSGKIVPLGLGKYAWHVPNAVFASLGNVSAVLNVTGAIDVHCEWLVVADNRDLATKPVNVTQFGGSNITAAGGIPEVKVASMADNTLTAAAISADAGAELAALVETYIVNEGDATAVMQAIADKIAADWVAGDASPLAIAAAVRTNLATELARIDAAISTRLAAAGYTAPATPTNVSDAQAAILARLPAALESGRIAATLDSAYDPAKTAATQSSVDALAAAVANAILVINTQVEAY